MFHTSNKTLANLAHYVDGLITSQSQDFITQEEEKIALLRTVLKETLYAYVMQYPHRVNKAFIALITESLDNQLPKKTLLKSIKQKLSRKSLSENKEAFDIFEIIENEKYQDVYELQKAIENYLSTLSHHKTKKKHIGAFILNALESYYERIILPETFFQADFDHKKKALVSSVEKGIKHYNLFTVAEEDRLKQSFQDTIMTLKDDNEIRDFLKNPSTHIEHYKNLPKKFILILEREFKVYQNKDVKFGEFYSNQNTYLTIQDYIEYSLDKFQFNTQQDIQQNIVIMIRAIYSILKNSNQMDQMIIKKIKQVFSRNKAHSLLQHRLKKYYKESIAAYLKSKHQLLRDQKRQQKTTKNYKLPDKKGLLIEIPFSFTIKILKPLNQLTTELNQFKKILVLLEGLHDHKNNLNKIAEEARNQGYLVITYYLYGIEPTKANLQLRLHMNTVRRYFRKAIQQLIQTFDQSSLTIYANGLNTIVPLNEHLFLENIDAIKCVLLESPAFSRINRTKNIKASSTNQPTHPKITIEMSKSKFQIFCAIPILIHFMHKCRRAILQLASHSFAHISWIIVGGYYDSPKHLQHLLELQSFLQTSAPQDHLRIQLFTTPNGQPNHDFLLQEHAKNILDILQ